MPHENDEFSICPLGPTTLMCLPFAHAYAPGAAGLPLNVKK